MNKRRLITLVSLAALLLGLVAGLPFAGVMAAKPDAEIGWIADFKDLSQWNTIRANGILASTMDKADSIVKAKDVTADGYGATLVGDGDWSFAYRQVEVDLDKYPYLYTKYTPESTSWYVLATQAEGLCAAVQTGDYAAARADAGTELAKQNVEVEGNYRRVNLKKAFGDKSGKQTFLLALMPFYANADWKIDYVFVGSDGDINGENAVKALSEPETPTITNQVDFSDLTKWYSFEGSNPNVYTLADEDSFIKIKDITADKRGATIYPKNFNGQFNMIAQKVTVDVDKTPYFYTKYHTELAEAARFQMFLHTEDHAWIVGEGKTTYSLFDGSGDANCTKDGEYYKYDLKAAGLSGVQTFFVCLCPNYIDAYNTWTIDYMFFGAADEDPNKGEEPLQPAGKWSMDLSQQAESWLWVGDCKGATYSDTVKNVLDGAESALKFTVGDDNGFGGKSLKAEFNYETPGTVFYQFIGTKLTVDVDKTPYLYFKGTFSRTDFFAMYLNDQEISGMGNGVSGDKTLHEGQVLDLKAHYKSGTHTFWLIAYFYDGDGDDDKPFTIDYAYVGDENDKPKSETEESEESKDNPPESSDNGESSEPSEAEPEEPVLTDPATGIAVKNPPEEAQSLRVTPITEGDDYAYVNHYAADKLKSFKAFDISLAGLTESLEPAGTLCFPLDEALTGKEVKVYHLSDDGQLTELTVTVKDGKAAAAFEKNGIYIVGTTGKAVENPDTGVPAAGLAALLLASAAAVCVGWSKRRGNAC